jgi:hypothetical protein
VTPTDSLDEVPFAAILGILGDPIPYG